MRIGYARWVSSWKTFFRFPAMNLNVIAHQPIFQKHHLDVDSYDFQDLPRCLRADIGLKSKMRAYHQMRKRPVTFDRCCEDLRFRINQIGVFQVNPLREMNRT